MERKCLTHCDAVHCAHCVHCIHCAHIAVAVVYGVEGVAGDVVVLEDIAGDIAVVDIDGSVADGVVVGFVVEWFEVDRLSASASYTAPIAISRHCPPFRAPH